MERKLTCPKCGAENLSWHSRCQQCDEELHKGEGKLPVVEGRGAGFWCAFVLNLLVVVFWGVMAIFAPGFLMFVAAPALAILLCWKWTLAAGIVLIAGAVLPIAGEVRTFGSMYELRLNFTAFTFIVGSLPLLFSGSLLILNWWNHRQDER